MFVTAIEKVSHYTRPVCFVERLNNDELITGTATLFFVNDEGIAITCKHVVNALIEFNKTQSKALENTSYKEVIYSFPNCYSKLDSVQFLVHPLYDLAIIKFNGTGKLYTDHCVFLKDTNQINQGKSLCRLGFAFPEFTNFEINSNDKLVFNNKGNPTTPLFPIDGIITRLVKDQYQVFGIELSTPGFRGQSGGPLFDTNGIIYGMQSLTKHYHLGFDIVNQEVRVGQNKKIISNYPFINLGQCVHTDIIKDFLRKNNIVFYEE